MAYAAANAPELALLLLVAITIVIALVVVVVVVLVVVVVVVVVTLDLRLFVYLVHFGCCSNFSTTASYDKRADGSGNNNRNGYEM